ncbi:hypothetical protein RFF05_03180 [Bengtsoniella intestinalis]|uniref:hypothetical protein n=1 Tax=Bengtsoniella intestinalis TaxID=3073143 RepID=UPI00391F2D64
MSLELFSNFLQALVAVAVAIWATRVAIGEKTVAYTLAAGMLDTMALGILYWLTYQFMTDMTPQVFYVADVSWLAAYLFLLALELYLTVPEVKKKRHFAMYIPIPIGIGLTLYFCQWGMCYSTFPIWGC